MKIAAEDSLLLASFATHPGLAMLVHSECQPSARSAELLKANESLLCGDAKRLLNTCNAGGASRVSEAISIELLHRAFGARLLKTETEIIYWPTNGSITDFAVELAGVCIGVSVTRAMHAPGAPVTTASAAHLLRKKLRGVLSSTETCLGQWQKQILHIWARSSSAAAAIDAAYATLEHELLADTVVICTVCEGEALSVLFDEKLTTLPIYPPARVPKGMKDAAHQRVLAESDPCKREPRAGYGVVV